MKLRPYQAPRRQPNINDMIYPKGSRQPGNVWVGGVVMNVPEPSGGPAVSPTPTPSITATNTPTPSVTATITPTNTPTNTVTPTKTLTPTPTPTPSNTAFCFQYYFNTGGNTLSIYYIDCPSSTVQLYVGTTTTFCARNYGTNAAGNNGFAPAGATVTNQGNCP